jgi:hypothetical protein
MTPFRNKIQSVQLAIAIHYQAGDRTQDRWRVEDIRQGFRDTRRPNVPSDVAGKLGGREAQVMKLRRNIPAGVIAENHESAFTAGPKDTRRQFKAPSVTRIETSIPRKDERGPKYVPESGRTCFGSQATATRIRLRLPMMLLVGSKSTHPAPGK